MDKSLRNELRNVVTACRKLLEEAVQKRLEGTFGVQPTGHIEDANSSFFASLTPQDREYRTQIVVHLEHIMAAGFTSKDAVLQLVREVAFTHLNRLCAFKMMEERELLEIGGRSRSAVSQALKSQGFIFYLADHPDDENLWRSGQQDIAYRHFLIWLGSTFADEIQALFSPNDPANRLFPPQRVLDQVLELINRVALKDIWKEDETIGWIYQYFTPKELREESRKKGAPQNSYELAFRNQFYTPSYVVQFLSDNTLGRIWYEMRGGETRLKEQCRYLVYRRSERFLGERETEPASSDGTTYIAFRAKKDPRQLKILDPAGGSGHFLLYCFGLLQTIYEEAWDDRQLGPKLQQDYSDFESFRKRIPGLILRHNLHCIDIDLRATQIAALALWLRAQRAYQKMGLKRAERPPITKSNIVCAEPMPGEAELLDDFAASLRPKVLGDMVRVIFEKMKLAGEAGSLLKIEEEITSVVAGKKRQYQDEMERATDKLGNIELLTRGEVARLSGERQSALDFSDITDEQFWENAEQRILDELRRYAQEAANGQGLVRQLFAEDAERGFAFVDICRKRFDVVLMNPPFGEMSDSGFDYIDVSYPTWNRNLLCAFLQRGWDLSSTRGALGAIYDRTAAVKSSYEKFRRASLVNNHLFAFADLGWEVLDANVEVTTSVLHHTYDGAGAFFDVRSVPSSDKGQSLLQIIHDFQSGLRPKHGTILARAAAFGKFPNAIIGYDLPQFMIRAFENFPSLEAAGFKAYQGHALEADVHYRLWWEPPLRSSHAEERPWCFAFKGGDYSPFFLLSAEVALYGRNGSLVPKSTANVLRNLRMQQRAGVGFGKRGTFLDAQPIAEGQIFTHEGHAFPGLQPDDAFFLLSFLNSDLFSFGINTFCGQHKTSGYVNLFPLASFSSDDRSRLTSSAKAVFEAKSKWYLGDETNPHFTIPFGCELWRSKATLAAVVDRVSENLNLETTGIRKKEEEISALITAEYHLTEDEQNLVNCFCRNRPKDVVWYDRGELTALETKVELVQVAISYSVGVVVGRWDVRLATGERPIPELPDPFAPLSFYSPGMLTEEPRDYPLAIDGDGILPDDPDHQDDIARRVHEVFSLIWRERVEAIEQEACTILGVKELRDYFRKPAVSGFWADHIARYSKSRQAPIYWLLQSARKNYGFWLYYHRVDRDTLSKALINYVEPKLRLEENRLKELRSSRAEVGATTSTARSLDRRLERQDELLSELRDFKEKLRRVIDLHLDPDLNDGVLLNIAPLWELVPWKEAKKYWDELEAGKYEWSSIAKQLRANFAITASSS